MNGACYHFEGTTIKDVVVKDCPGECTNWSGCIEWYPERECEKAEGYYEARYREEEKEGIDWVFYFTFLFVIFSIGGCICMLGVCMAKANGDRPKPVWEINREHFDKHDFKYWDSILPPQKPGDGAYAHLILNRNGDILGVKPGFNEDGTKIGSEADIRNKAKIEEEERKKA